MRWILRGIVLTTLLALALLAFAPQVIGLPRVAQPLAGQQEPSGESRSALPGSGAGDQTSETSVNADDAQQQPGIYMSPLFDGIAKLGNQIADATQQDELSPSSALAQADRSFSDIKAKNRVMLSDLQRPYRKVSPSTRHVILVTVSGLNQSDINRLPDKTSYLRSMYEKGLRFTQYYAPVDRDAAWKQLLSGRLQAESNTPSTALLSRIWRSGYLTALVGDTSQAPSLTVDGRTVYDFHYGVGSGASRDAEFAQQVSSNGRSIELLDAEDGSRMRTQDVMIHEAGAFIKENGRGRPFFLHLALDVTGPESKNMSQRVAFLDSRLRGLFEFTEREQLNHRLIVVVAGLGLFKHDEQLSMAGVPVVSRMPLLMYWPDRKIGRTVSTHTTVFDVLPTIADLTDAAIPNNIDGMPLIGPSSPEVVQETRTLIWPRQSKNQAAVILQQPWELILSDPPRLYDSVADPNHRHNLANELPAVVEELRDQIGIEL